MKSSVINYTDSPHGYLEIIKIYGDGSEEVHYADDNVITSGLGYTLLKAFSTAGSVSSFQIVYFQLGDGGSSGLQVSSTGSLGSPLPVSGYGTANFELDTHDVSSGSGIPDSAFGVIPFAYIKKISPTRVMYQIFVGEDACNGQTINEVGLFSRNPDNSTPEGSYLCAYRYFTPLDKNNSFSLLFRWTLEF